MERPAVLRHPSAGFKPSSGRSDAGRMIRVSTDPWSRQAPSFADRVTLARLEKVVEEAERAIPAPPTDAAALTKLSALAYRLQRGY